jgi:hypothetical protein
VSKKFSLPFIGIEPVKLEVEWQTTTVLARPGQQFTRTGRLFYRKGTFALNVDMDLAPGLQIGRFDYRSGEANSQATTPLCDLHFYPMDIHHSVSIVGDAGGQRERRVAAAASRFG